MMKEKDTRELFKSIFHNNRDLDFVEAVLYQWDSSLTRVAYSNIHQHVAENNCQLFLSISKGKRTCSTSTSILNLQSIQKELERVRMLLTQISPLPYFQPPSVSGQSNLRSVFSKNTAECSPGQKVEIIKNIIKRAQGDSLTTHAKFMTGTGEIWVANSFGTLQCTDFTDATLSLILTGEGDVSGYGAFANPDVSKIDWEELSQAAIEKCRMQKKGKANILNPGKEAKLYDVILEPYAVSQWVKYLAWIGFNSLHYQENESFMCHSLGQKIMGENVTIWDDGLDSRGYVMPFDFEGTLKKKTVFIENGVAKSLAYDSHLASMEGKQNGGHALLPNMRDMGAIPSNLFMEGGPSSIEEMITSSKEPTIYISRFHYNNTLNRKEALLTGMTRDGTFLVEGGEIKYPIANLRYVQSLPEAFKHITMLSPLRVVHDPEGYLPIMPESTVVPALKMEGVRFLRT